MSNLISATLTPKAMEIYKEMEKGQKSRIISELIEKDLIKQLRHEAFQKQINAKNMAISRVIWELKDNPIHRALLTDLNELLIGTIHYQNW
tara:strand:- start:1487 stop:1759 length:273 start_codon:yes stop_codon:yes gene_type:complete